MFARIYYYFKIWLIRKALEKYNDGNRYVIPYNDHKGTILLYSTIKHARHFLNAEGNIDEIKKGNIGSIFGKRIVRY